MLKTRTILSRLQRKKAISSTKKTLRNVLENLDRKNRLRAISQGCKTADVEKAAAELHTNRAIVWQGEAGIQPRPENDEERNGKRKSSEREKQM